MSAYADGGGSSTYADGQLELQAISKVNPLTYEVEALRALLVGTSTVLWLDFVVLAGATVAGITASSMLLPRLAR